MPFKGPGIPLREKGCRPRVMSFFYRAFAAGSPKQGEMSDSPGTRFAPRWKEELVCTLEGRSFVIEFSMGSPHTYLPAREKWEAIAPAWAKPVWERVHADLTSWCESEKIPLTVDANAWVFFDPEAA